jgi:PucR family transcriptional regulator, purine catabolism regulatory protein
MAAASMACCSLKVGSFLQIGVCKRQAWYGQACPHKPSSVRNRGNVFYGTSNIWAARAGKSGPSPYDLSTVIGLAECGSSGGEVSPITVAGALELPAMRRGLPEVVAGRPNLDRPIRWVHAGEVPNMASLLKGGELLLTTGMGIGGSRAGQQRFVSALAERRVAAVAIELGTTFKRMPDPLASEANRAGLPLIALHAEVPFVAITEAIHREIVSHQYVLMRRADELHERFTELMLQGAGIPEVLGALAEAIGNPVLLEKGGQDILYHAIHRASDHEVLGAWELVHQEGPGAPDSFGVPVPTAGAESWGRLVALSIDSPLDDFDRVAVERAVGLIALTLLRSRQEEMLAARERGSFFAELLGGEIDELEARRRTRAIGFGEPSALLLPAAIGHEPPTPASPAGEEAAWALIARDIRRELESNGTPVMAGAQTHEQRVLLAVGLQAQSTRERAGDRIYEAAASAVERQLGPRARWAISVGPVATSWTRLREAFGDALDAIPAALAGAGRTWLDATRPDLDRLLFDLAGARELRRFAEQRLQPLLEHDARRKGKLLPTLETYLACGGRKAETARQLHLERQSLYHRLDRIAQILGASLDDEDTRLGLHLALRASAKHSASDAKNA